MTAVSSSGQKRKIVGDDIEYSPLQEEESIGDENIVIPNTKNREMRGRSRIGRLKSKVGFVFVALLVVLIWLWWTSDNWWPHPGAIVWSDNMNKRIYRKSNERLVDRIVHFDLKGAAPKVEYLKKLFPLLRQWGATGVLMEWEDMFPYHGELEKVRHGDAYNDKAIKEILQAAKDAGLKIIPLLQTFGHMEWILKQPSYSKVREITRYPQVICPTNNESLPLVQLLIDDIVETHKGFIDTIHIGADEAYHVATECKRCQNRLKELGALDKLMLEYVTKVARYVKKKHGLRVMMWNDMYEKTETSVLRAYGLHELVEPVIWGYAEYLLAPNYFADGVFNRFGEAKFEKLWIASAFKGANGPDQPFVDLQHYAQNHLSWLQVMNYYDRPLKNVGGIILTGWQRFDHFAILCELLPPALPSLVFNLQVIKYGGMTPQLFDLTRKALNCEVPNNWTLDAPEWESIIERFRNLSKYNIPRPPALQTLSCKFPGSEIYALMERLRLVKHEYDTFMNHSIRRGWMHEYNIHHSYGSVHHAEITFNVTEALSTHFSLLGHLLREELSKIYYDDTVAEWLYENIQVHLDELKRLSLGAVQIKQTVAFRNRPLAHMKLDL